MKVKITSTYRNKGNRLRVIYITAEAQGKSIDYAFFLDDTRQMNYLVNWLKKQPVIAEKKAQTWSECMKAVIGTIVDLPKRYEYPIEELA